MPARTRRLLRARIAIRRGDTDADSYHFADSNGNSDIHRYCYCYSYGDIDGYRYYHTDVYRYRYGYAYRYSYGYTLADSYTYWYAQSDAHAKDCADAENSSQSAAAAGLTMRSTLLARSSPGVSSAASKFASSREFPKVVKKVLTHFRHSN